MARFLVTNGHLHVGGVEKSLVSFLRSIDYSTNQVDLLLFEDLGEYKQYLPDEVNVIFWDFSLCEGSVLETIKRALSQRRWDIALIKLIITAANKMNPKFYKLLKCFGKTGKEYDCAIAYRVGMPLDYVSYAVKARKKLVWWHHGEFNYPNSLVEKWRKCFSYMNRIVCVSESSMDMIAPFFPEYRERLCVIPNMVIPEEIEKLAKLVYPYSSVSNKKIIVSVGRLSEEKHMIDAVHAAKILRDRGISNFVWYLVGDGVQRPKIEQLIEKYDLREAIKLVGNQDNPYPYVYYADVYVHPSWVESQGISVLEAMVLRKKSVVVHSSGTDEFVVDKYNAISAERDIYDLAEKVEFALTGSDRLNLEIGQEKTVEKYVPVAVMEKIYLEIQ